MSVRQGFVFAMTLATMSVGLPQGGHPLLGQSPAAPEPTTETSAVHEATPIMATDGTDTEPSGSGIDPSGSICAPGTPPSIADQSIASRHFRPSFRSPSYFQWDAMLFHRANSARNQTLAEDTDEDPDLTVLRSGDLDFDVTGGSRFLLGWNPDWLPSNSSLELSYLGVFDLGANKSVFGNNNLAIPGDLGLNSNNFMNADRITADYQSYFHDVEFNHITACCHGEGRWEKLHGFRFIVLNEQLGLVADDSDEGIGRYDVDTNNYLYGIQSGRRYTRSWRRWSLSGTGKVGVFLNDAGQRQEILDDPDNDGLFPLRERIGSRDTGIAGLGEIGFVAVRPINSRWSLRLGYTAIGISDVALAPDQLDFTNAEGSGKRLDASGWLFLHGGLVGLEARW